MEAADETAARAIMDVDPAVKAGVMIYDLNAVRAFFDAFAGTAWSPPVSESVANRCRSATSPAPMRDFIADFFSNQVIEGWRQCEDKVPP